MKVFYNHGKTIHGMSSERFSMPLGTPEQISADGRGLMTVTKYNKTSLADDILEGIASGSITSQSFSGRFVKSDRVRARSYGDIDRITRNEIMLREYGPCPMPVYDNAAILAVRAVDLAEWRNLVMGLDATERAELLDMLSTARSSEDGSPLPTGVAGAPSEGATTPSVTDPPEPDEGHHASPAGPSLAERRARALDLTERLIEWAS